MSRMVLVFAGTLRHSFRIAIAFLALLVLAGRAVVAAPTVLPAPDFFLLSRGVVDSIELQPDGRIVLGGNFNWVNGQHQPNFTRLNQDGSIDTAFVPLGANGTVNATLLLGTHLFIGGSFTQIGGQSHVGFASLSVETGEFDPLVMDLNSGGSITTLATDGTDVYAGGTFNAVNGQPRAGLFKFAGATGVLDPVWKPAIGVANTYPSAMITDNESPVPADRVFVAYNFFATTGPSSSGGLLAFDARTGAPDTTFNPNPDASVTSIVRIGGKLYFGGNFSKIGGINTPNLARFDKVTFGNDASFSFALRLPVTQLATDNGNLYASYTTPSGGVTVARIDPATGNVIADTGPNTFNGPVNSLKARAGKLLAAGSFDHFGEAFLHSLGQMDPTTVTRALVDYGVSADGSVNTVQPLPDGSQFVAGSFNEVGGREHQNVALLNPDGTLNNSWIYGVTGSVRALAADSTYVYLGGSITAPFQGLGRIHLGTHAAEQLPAPNTSAINVMLLADDFIYVGGVFGTLGSAVLKNLGRISVSSKTVDIAFTPNPDDQVHALTVCQNNLRQLALGGNFHNVGGQQRNGLAVVSTIDGQAAPAFNANLTFNGQTSSVVIFGTAAINNTLYAAGGFNASGIQAHAGIGAFDCTTGQTIPAFNNQLSTVARALATDGSSLFVGYPGSLLGSQTVNGLIALSSATGALVKNYNVTAKGVAAQVGTIVYNPVTGTVAFTGNFDSADGFNRYELAGLGTATIDSVVVVEFFDPTGKHYFVTANPEEAAALRANPGLGFLATGGAFNAYHKARFPSAATKSSDARSPAKQQADSPTPATPVSRFYGSVTPGPNSHLYVASPAEAAGLRSLQYIQPDNQPRWNFEEIAFAINLPDAAGNCPASAPVPVYRAYNNRALQADANHRLTTDLTAYNQMAALGWILEGKVMCALP